MPGRQDEAWSLQILLSGAPTSIVTPLVFICADEMPGPLAQAFTFRAVGAEESRILASQAVQLFFTQTKRICGRFLITGLLDQGD